MKLWSKTLLAAALVGSAAYAAPGLTVSGTDLMYNGKKIFFDRTSTNGITAKSLKSTQTCHL